LSLPPVRNAVGNVSNRRTFLSRSSLLLVPSIVPSLVPSPAISSEPPNQPPSPTVTFQNLLQTYDTTFTPLTSSITSLSYPSIKESTQTLDLSFRKRYLVPLYKTLPSSETYSGPAFFRGLKSPKDVGVYYTNAVSWDLIAISKWARKEGTVEEGRILMEELRKDVEEYEIFGRKYTQQ